MLVGKLAVIVSNHKTDGRTEDQMNHCIHCEQPAFSRGVCRTHYSRYDRAKRLAKDGDAYDAAAVEAGLILACGEARRRALQCAFAALLIEPEPT